MKTQKINLSDVIKKYGDYEINKLHITASQISKDKILQVVQLNYAGQGFVSFSPVSNSK